MAEHRLYLMAMPPPPSLARIEAHPRTDRSRPPCLLHATLLSFVDLTNAPPEFVPVLKHKLNGFAADPFDFRFDRIEERKVVALRGSDNMKDARHFKTNLT